MIIKLSSTNSAAVGQDIERLIPGWSSTRRSPMRGISFINLGDRQTGSRIYTTENGFSDVEPVYAGETRYDVVVPENFILPELMTRVFPDSSDHQLY